MSYTRTPETLAKLRASAKRAHPRKGATVACVVCGEVFYVNPSRVGKARCCSLPCNQAYRRSASFRAARREQSLGSKSHFWKGGVTPENKVARESTAVKDWALAVKERDNFTCQNCGVRGGVLHSHHIIPFATAPHMRCVLANGVTLCGTCHREWHRKCRSG